MKKRLLTLLLGLIGLTATVLAENYNLWIANIQVTSSNCNSLHTASVAVSQGTMIYDPATSTLSLTDVVLNAGGNFGIRVTGIDNFTLELHGDNTLTNTTSSRPGLEFANSKNVTITGPGSLSITSPSYDIMYFSPSSERTITLTGGASLNLLGYGFDDNGDYDGKLIVDGANLFVNRSNGHCFLAIQELEVRNADIVQPADASQYTWIYQSFYKDGGNGTEYTGDIEIKANLEQEAEIVKLLNASRYDVDGNGSLTLADLTLLANALVGRVNYPARGILLSKSSLTLLKGTNTGLVCNIYPSNADYASLLWKTSNRQVATVDSYGIVTGVGAGTCTITATTIDGSNLSASCNVTVVQPVTSIQLSSNSLSIANRTKQQLTATVLPSNAYNTNVTWTTSDANVATVSETGLVTALRGGTCTITCTAADGSGASATCNVSVYWQDRSGAIGNHAYVDLGLLSGTLWATTNVGASSPEGHGTYYAWGATTATAQGYTLAHYFDNEYTTYNFNGGQTELLPQHDAAYVNWGANWRMPTYEQMQELVRECSLTWKTQNGVSGCEFVGKNGKSIFLPAGGEIINNGTSPSNVGDSGYYWTRTLDERSPGHEARILIVWSDGCNTGAGSRRYNGLTVRPVLNQ